MAKAFRLLRVLGHVGISQTLVSSLSVVFIAVVIVAGVTCSVAVTTAYAQPRSVTIWIQVMDSCKEALPGATFKVVGPGVSIVTAPTTGQVPKIVPGHNVSCPLQEGTCAFTTGCTAVQLNVPSDGSATYKISPEKTAPGHGANLRYAICNGGSDCAHGPEVATVYLSPHSGAVFATVFNPYPDGTGVIWPTSRSAYSGTKTDPIVFHEFGIGNGSIQCDGDHDKDDFLTGSPSSHCDSDKKRRSH